MNLPLEIMGTGVIAGLGFVVWTHVLQTRSEERLKAKWKAWSNRMGGGPKGSSSLGQPPMQLSAQEQQWLQSQQNVAGLSQIGGAGASQALPYPYSQGYPTPDRQSYSGGSELRVPFRYETKPPEEVSVDPIPGPMDVIVNNRPRKMRVKE